MRDLNVTGFRGNPTRVVLSDGREATISQKLIDAFASPSPQPKDPARDAGNNNVELGVWGVAVPSEYRTAFYHMKTGAGYMVFTIHPNGTVEIGEHFTKDDAAKAFWDYVLSVDPRGTPSPTDHVVGLDQIGCITEGGSIEWFKPPIRKGTVLYAAPGSTLKPEEIECVCKRDVCTYDHDFGCGMDRSKERQDV